MRDRIVNHFIKVCEERKEAVLKMWENPYQHESWEAFAERTLIKDSVK